MGCVYVGGGLCRAVSAVDELEAILNPPPANIISGDVIRITQNMGEVEIFLF